MVVQQNPAEALNEHVLMLPAKEFALAKISSTGLIEQPEINIIQLP